MELQITPQEQVLLTTILRERQRELLHEISRADVHSFRRALQDRELVLESLLRKLSEETMAA
jgi:vacuolar-type H+-ATPase subunit E/Vma4